MTAKYPPVQFRLPTVLYEQLDRLSGKVSVSEKAKAIVLDYLLAQSTPSAPLVTVNQNHTTGTPTVVKVSTVSTAPKPKPKKKMMRRKPLEIADEILKKREGEGITGGWKAGMGLLGDPDIDMMTGEPRLADAAPWFENGEWYWIEGGEKFRSTEKPDLG